MYVGLSWQKETYFKTFPATSGSISGSNRQSFLMYVGLFWPISLLYMSLLSDMGLFRLQWISFHWYESLFTGFSWWIGLFDRYWPLCIGFSWLIWISYFGLTRNPLFWSLSIDMSLICIDVVFFNRSLLLCVGLFWLISFDSFV